LRIEEKTMERRVTFYEETNFKTTEIGEIPADWEVVKLGELYSEVTKDRQVYLEDDKEYKQVTVALYANGLRLRRVALGRDIAVKKQYLIRTGDLIFSKIDARNGAYGFVNECLDGAIVSGDFPILEMKGHSCDEYFLWYYLKIDKNWHKFRNLAIGTTNRKRIQAKEFMNNLLVPLPPLEEQKAIAYVLSTVQEALEKTEKVIEATKELKKSLMKHLFTYGPVSLEEASRINLKETEIGEIPADWEVVKLGEVVTEESPPTEKDPEVSVIPFIPMALIPEDGIFVNSWELRRREDIRSGIQVFEGDLLVAKITPCFENGKQGIVSQLPLPYAYATTEVLRLRARERIILEYVALFLKQGSVRTLLASKMQGTTGRKRLSRHVLKDLPLPLPPLPVQKRIAEILQTVDEKIQAEEKKKQALDNLFNSMLHMLMSGKLRVKFQTSEEGASN